MTGHKMIVVRTASKIFSDRSVLDLVRIPKGELGFVISDGKTVKTATQFVRNGERYVPLRIDPTILRSLRLPSKIAAYDSTRKLFNNISDLISQVTSARKDVVELLTFFVFSTWLSDSLPSAPFLWIVSPPMTSTGPLEQMLTLLCRRALVVSERSLPKFHSLAVDLQPTLVTKVFEPTRRHLNLLRTLTRRGTLTAVGGKFVEASSAIVVFAPEPLRDQASAGFPLELELFPTADYIPRLSASKAEQIAAEYQPQLLQHRLLTLPRVKAPAFDLSQFTIPMQDLAHNLGACIVDDNELQARLVVLLKPADREVRVGYASLLTAIVLEVLLARCHTATGKYFAVTDVCKDVNTVLRARGDVTELSPEKVGWNLRALGIRTEFILRGRKGLVLSDDVRKKIHELALAYGVRTLRELPEKPQCPLCAALSLPWKQATATGTNQANAGNQ
jgi:hypothetical protein